MIVESTKYEWRVCEVGGMPERTIGYADGDRMSRNLPQALTRFEDEGWEIFSINVASSTTAIVVARRPRPVETPTGAPR